MRFARPLKILLVEDDSLTAMAMARMLEMAHCTVTTVTDGEAGLSALADGSFDAVITDLVMPRLGGEAMIRQLRRDWPDLPIVVLSASPPDDGISGLQDREGGPLVILRKPVLAGELLTAMERVFVKT
ncbi:response regulator [Azospirillum brasilense]|uniref:response regulator n=1 Tax=Azospirillum brasilense TaxID=192 RepID=UPI001EDC50F0|nr:response regulator [Azospirillum brasilense]UKJ74592.1 response regulator [Azospirillum brasilense]